jgi:hypothetical protein
MYVYALVDEGLMTKEDVESTVIEHSEWLNNNSKSMDTYEGVSKSFWTESIKTYMLITINTH